MRQCSVNWPQRSKFEWARKFTDFEGVDYFLVLMREMLGVRVGCRGLRSHMSVLINYRPMFLTFCQDYPLFFSSYQTPFLFFSPFFFFFSSDTISKTTFSAFLKLKTIYFYVSVSLITVDVSPLARVSQHPVSLSPASPHTRQTRIPAPRLLHLSRLPPPCM